MPPAAADADRSDRAGAASSSAARNDARTTGRAAADRYQQSVVGPEQHAEPMRERRALALDRRDQRGKMPREPQIVVTEIRDVAAARVPQPSAFGADCDPEFVSRLIQWNRASPSASTTSWLPSVQASPTTQTSKSSKS